MPKKQALTHEDCLFRVCAVCTNLRGVKVERKVSEEEERKIQVFNPLYKRGSIYFPQGLCSTCHIFLLKRKDAEAVQGGDEEKGSMRDENEDEGVRGEGKKRKRPLPNVEPLFPENFLCFLPHETRNAPQVSCTCRWCKIGRLHGYKLNKTITDGGVAPQCTFARPT